MLQYSSILPSLPCLFDQVNMRSRPQVQKAELHKSFLLLYTMLYIVLAYLMLFAALTNSVCLNNASFFFLFKYFLCQDYELSGEIALKNNHYYYYYYYYSVTKSALTFD